MSLMASEICWESTCALLAASVCATAPNELMSITVETITPTTKSSTATIGIHAARRQIVPPVAACHPAPPLIEHERHEKMRDGCNRHVSDYSALGATHAHAGCFAFAAAFVKQPEVSCRRFRLGRHGPPYHRPGLSRGICLRRRSDYRVSRRLDCACLRSMDFQ